MPMAIVAVMLQRTVFGRSIYAIGNKEAAAYLAGINTKGVTVACFALCGLTAGLAGVLLAGYSQMALGFTDRALGFAAQHPETGFPFVANSTKVLTLIELKQYDEAERFAKTAMIQAQTGDRRIKEIELEMMLSRIADARKQPDQALAYLEQARTAAATGQVQRLLADAEEGLAEAYRNRGRPESERSFATTILADYGHRVLVLEREKFPRYHIGESLIPFTYQPLHRLGLIPKMRSSAFVKKYSVVFISPAAHEIYRDLARDGILSKHSLALAPSPTRQEPGCCK